MDAKPPQLPERARARNWLIVNLFACPGLGSWLGGRRVTGALQMLLAFAGFALVVGGFGGQLRDLWRDFLGKPGETGHLAWMTRLGYIWFACAWVWSALTGWIVWRESGRDES